MSIKQVFQHTLSNGLKLIGEYSPANQSAAVGFFVRTGSRDETIKESGVSHFLEHMMFKGTAKRDSQQLTFDMGNIGAQANAYTSEENTVYYSVILPEYFEQMQEILCDMLRPSLVEEEFQMERKVILEEIALYQDRPTFYLFENAMKDYFAGHPAGNSVLGSVDSIKAVSRDEMADYFRRRYSPSNMVFVAAGNFNWDKFVRDAEAMCGTWQNFEAGREVTRYRRPTSKKVFEKATIQQSHLLYMTHGPSAQDDERFAASILGLILGDGSGSKMYWDLVQTGLAESASADSDDRDGTGCFYAYASTDPENLEEVADRMQKILAKPLDFDQGDLQRAKTKVISRLVSSGELPMGRLSALGTEWLYRGEIHDLKQTIAQFKAVDRPAIERYLEKYPLTEWSEYRLVRSPSSGTQ